MGGVGEWGFLLGGRLVLAGCCCCWAVVVDSGVSV